MEIGVEKKKLTLKEIGPKRLAIIMVCGIALLVLTLMGEGDSQSLFPTGEATPAPTMADIGNYEGNDNMSAYIKDMEERMEKQLVLVEGVGNVKVMITLKSSAEKIVLKDNTNSEEIIDETDSSGGSRNNKSTTQSDESILIDGQEGSVPYTIKETSPYIQGVVVVAEGGDDARTKQEIIDAVQVLFDVEVHKIKVMKMISD